METAKKWHGSINEGVDQQGGWICQGMTLLNFITV